jgi:hypothetical protein
VSLAGNENTTEEGNNKDGNIRAAVTSTRRHIPEDSSDLEISYLAPLQFIC